jgi:hypothetical protein
LLIFFALSSIISIVCSQILIHKIFIDVLCFFSLILSMSFLEDIVNELNHGLNKYYHGKYSHLAKAAGVHGTTVKKILSGGNLVWLGNLARVADATRTRVCQDGGSTYIEPAIKSFPNVEQADHDSKQIPLFDTGSAIQFIEGLNSPNRPEISPIRHIQISTKFEFIKYRSDLLAVEIHSQANCMSNTLNPGDIAVIDIKECIPHQPPGNIYLVKEPGNGKAHIKRVRSQRVNDSDFLVFYGDNPGFGPEMFSLERDYKGRLADALKGKVVAAFSNMSFK